MKKNIVCIECPKGCILSVDMENSKVAGVTGNKCPKGKNYAVREVESPERVLTSTVSVKGAAVKLAPVKTDKPVPKDKLMDAMKIIKAIKINRPVKCGEVILPGLLGLNINLIATRTVE